MLKQDQKQQLAENNRIAYILVNYFNENETISLIENHILKQTYETIDIIIVNNGVNNYSSLENIKTIFNNIFVFSPGENKGYFGGAKFGIESYMKITGSMPSAVILSNSDIEIPDENFIEQMIKKTVEMDLDITGPKIISLFSKIDQNPYMKERAKRSKIKLLYTLSGNALLYNLFLTFFYLKSIISKFKKKSCPESGDIQKVYSIHGSFMFFNKTFFEKGGNFDYKSFLFGEEIFIGELGINKGLCIAYLPDCQIIHKEHYTTGFFQSKIMLHYFHESYKHILNTYYA
jgi:GT2 family glycosyltransferase